YGLHHVWQAVGARLAGYLGLVTLAEARDVIRGAPDATLRRFVAERVADARAREAARATGLAGARPLATGAPSSAAPSAVSPSAVSPSAVSPSAVSPSAVSPSVVSPSL